MIDEDGHPLGEMERRGARPPPEQRLYASVILQAVKDSKITSLRETYLRDDAVRWLTGNCRDFNTVCEMAGLSPEWVLDRCRHLRVPDLRGRKSNPRKQRKDSE